MELGRDSDTGGQVIIMSCCNVILTGYLCAIIMTFLVENLSSSSLAYHFL